MAQSRVALLAAVVVLFGAGCLGGGSSTADNGGFFASTDGGANWIHSVALPNAEAVGTISSVNVTSLEMDPSDTSALYLGTTSNGMVYSLDGGASWMRAEDERVRSGAVVGIEVDPRDVCTVYVLRQSSVLKTENCHREYAEMYVQSTSDTLTSMAIDWYNPNTLYVGTTGGDLLRTLDGGETWSTIARMENITTVAVSNADSRILLVGTRSGGMQRSTDGGATWTEYEKTLKDYRNADRVYDFAQSADGTSLYMSSKYGILVSHDSGATWEDVPLITAGGEVEITALAVDPDNGDHVLYGTATTLHRSTSGGTAWMTEALPTARGASALLVSPEDSQIMYMGVATMED